MGQNLGPLNIKDTYQSLVQISGSVLTDGSGSAIPSVTVNASTATSASFATTATTSTSDSYASTATSASYATTASFALNVTPIDTGSFVTTASISDATITFTKADASTFNIEVNNVSSSISASHADNASTADSATTATSASFATTASFAGNAGSSFLATSASHALVADTATSASYATNASTADSATSASHAVNADSATTATTATSASYATTASHALGLVDGLNINATSITASGANFTNLTATSASIGFLQTVTGSATIIGDAFILLNTSDATRYAGLLVEDSGSATPVNYTASWFFDSLTNDWNYEYTSGSTDYGVALFGPTYSTKGTPTYLTANTIPKGQGNHHLVDSNISDDGSTITLGVDTTLSKTGAAATLIVTSDDDYTYQSTLTLGGQPGGAGDPVTISNFGGVGYLAATNGFSVSSDIVSSNNITAAAFTGSSFTGSFTGSFNGSITLADTASKATILSTGDNAGYPLIFAAATAALTESVALRKDDDGRIYWNPATEKLTVDGGSIQTTYLTSSFSTIGGAKAAEIQVDNAITLGTTATTASIKGVASLWLSATNNTGSITGFPDAGRMIIGGENQTISGGTYSMIIGAPASTISSTADQMTIVGGSSNQMSNSGQGILLGGVSNQLQGTRSFLIGGQNNKMGSGAGAGAQYSGIVGGYDNSNDGAYSFTMGSYNNIPSGYSEAIVIGTNITASENSAVHLDNTIVSGSLRGITKAIIPSASTGSMDCSTANFFTLTLANAADTHLTATNVKQGQTINLKLTNNATAAGTISFNTSIFKFEGGVPFTATATTNAVDVMTFISFDGSTFQATGLTNFS